MGLDRTTAIDMFFRQIIVERRLPFQPVAHPTLDEQIIAAILKNNTKRIELEADAEGNVIIDKDLHPDIYNWALKG
jgi:addiction module RelB/DinJ family antitoxin